jgi:hypothetical protein
MQAFIFNLYRVVYLFILLSLFSCSEKDDVLTRDYPRLNTLAVTNIQSAEALFHAEIISGDRSQILQYGFTWNEHVPPRIDRHEHIIIQESPKNSSFSYDVKSLKSNQIYFVRSFIKTEKLLIYGPVVSFKTK